MAYAWSSGAKAANADLEFGQVWDPSQVVPVQTTHGFATTVTSFSAAGTAWSDCDHSTSTSSSSSWPISSACAGDWSNTSSLSRDAAEDGSEWPSGPPIKRWQDPDTNTTAQIDQKEEEMMEDGQQEESNASYASPISKTEYDRQTKEYTEKAVADLIASPEYQKRHTTCELCWCVWAHNQFRDSCPECGGAAMKRTCPVCDGRCDAIWTRDVDLSHSNHYAHWEGECKLPWEQRKGFLMQKLLDSDEPVTDEQLVEDFSELKSS